MKNTSLLLEYIEKHYDRLVEAYGKAVVDAIKADFKKQMTDNPGAPGFSDPITKKPFTDDQLDTFIDAFDKIRSNLPSPQNDIYNYTTSKDKFELDDFFSLLAKKDKLTSKKDKEAEIPDIIYSSEDGNIKLFNGNREDLCTRHSRDVPWCITKGSWAGYRYSPERGYPTFYLVKNSNLPDSDKLSFVAIQARANDNWVYTNRKNSPYESRVMNWETLNSEIPWLSQIPDVKSKMPWVDISDQEKEERSFRDKPIPYSTWDLYLTPNQKLRYINIRNGRNTSYGDNAKLFSDMSEEKFVSEYFPKLDKSLRENLLRNQALNIDYLVDNYENPNFTDGDKALILRFYLQEGRLSVNDAEELLKKTTVPFQLKKDIVTSNKIAKDNRHRFFVTPDGEKIVEITFNSSFTDINLTVFTVKNGVTISKIFTDISPEIGTKYLSAYPELDTLPFKVLLKLASNKVVSNDIIKKVIDKAKNDTNSAMIVKELEDGSTLLIDTNAFEAYIIQDGKLDAVPFSSEEIQNVLSSEQGNSGVIDNILEPFRNGRRIPDSISKQTILSLIKNLEPEKRFITSRQGKQMLLIPAENINDTNLFKILYLDRGNLEHPYFYGGNGERWREPSRDWESSFTLEDFRITSDYFRSRQELYNDDNLRDIFNSAPRGGQAIVNFINSNPPLDPANTYRPIIYQNSLYLFNTQNPGNSLRLGAGGRLVNKSFNARDTAAITGQEAPAARRVRQAAPAAGGEEAGAEAPAAPEAGEANTATATVIEEYGLTAGVNALPASFRNRILTGQVVAADNGFQGRNRALGNRGRVVRIIANGPNRMYIIRLASGTYIAQASFQPDARHYIITTDAAFNMGRVGNFIDALAARNLTEDVKETLTRVALGAATKEELDEIKSKYKPKPYKNVEITESYIIREFDENIDPIELKWHRDREDRIVEIVGKTDWKLQLENQLPISINEPISIPKGEWHRVIKGTGKLTLKIIKEESTQYTFAGVLITNTSSEDGRPQKDILSDIRAIEGITIVTSKDYDLSGETNAFNNPNYYSIIKVKVDPNPYPTGFTSEDLQNMLKEIRAIKGVKNFKLNQAVEKTTV
jgi:hypothetical protein